MRFKPEIFGIRIGGDNNYFSATVGQKFKINGKDAVVTSIVDDHNYRQEFGTELIQIFVKDEDGLFLWKDFKNSVTAITYKR